MKGAQMRCAHLEPSLGREHFSLQPCSPVGANCFSRPHLQGAEAAFVWGKNGRLQEPSLLKLHKGNYTLGIFFSAVTCDGRR